MNERPASASAGRSDFVQEKVCGFWRLYTRLVFVSGAGGVGVVMPARSRMAVARMSTGSQDSV